MQYFGTNLTIYDEINAEHDIRDEVYNAYAEKVDELMEPVDANPEAYGLDFVDYSGKEEEDMNFVVGIADDKDAAIVEDFKTKLSEKLDAILRGLEKEFGVDIDASGEFEFDADEDGYYSDLYSDLDESKKSKKCEDEKKCDEAHELTEAELSAVAGSLASICKKYITGSFFDKLAAAYGISQAKDILLGDVKNILGHGTAKNGQAALAFINGIKRANNQVKVDQILTNVMLAGDGMSNKIGFSESTEEQKPTGFRAYLAEKAKNKDKKDEECCGKQCDERLCVSDKEVEEAKAIVEAMGFKVIEPSIEHHDEKPAEVDEGCCGGKKDKKKQIKESASEYVVVDCGGTKADPQGVKDLIDDAIATGAMDQAADAVIDIVIEGEKVLIYTEDPSTEFFAEVRRGVEKFLENAPGIEAEVGEDTIDDWKLAFDNSAKALSDLV